MLQAIKSLHNKSKELRDGQDNTHRKRGCYLGRYFFTDFSRKSEDFVLTKKRAGS